MLCAAPVWVATELGRQYVWDGFPWALLGYSQVTVLPIAQLASVTGVYGLSGLLALTLRRVRVVMLERGRSRWSAAIGWRCSSALRALWGSRRMAQGSLTTAGAPVRVAVIQGNIPQDDKWNPALRDAIIGRYMTLTRQAIERGATFILWPESALPVYFEEDRPARGCRSVAWRRSRRDAADRQRSAASPSPTAPGDAGHRLYNAAFLVKPDGSTGGVYRKMHLVPFGEYVPLQRLLFFVGADRRGGVQLHAGHGPRPAAGRTATWPARRSATR